MTYRWINLFVLGGTEGFVYFKAYVDETNRAVGWVTRTGISAPYVYNIYYLDGDRIVTGTRGTCRHADWAIQGAFQSQ